MFGFLNINKPKGITSHKVISILRKITGIKQIGHAGTLDPIAQGVLPIAIGKASKLIDYMPQDKEYHASMYLGFISDTFDTEGKVEKTNSKKITIEEIEKALNNFRGNISQIPPAFSAVHYNGKRLYELARKGNIPNDIQKRDITVYKNDIISFDYDKQILKLDIACSKGTYIRTIVNDLGTVLGSGAVMFELIRTKSSGMDIENSFTLIENTHLDDVKVKLINPIEVLQMNSLEVNDGEYKKLLNGNKFENRSKFNGELLLTKKNNIISIAYADKEFIQPRKVLL